MSRGQMVLGNVQGLGFLRAQGYRVPVKPVTVLVGLGSIVNALRGVTFTIVDAVLRSLSTSVAVTTAV